MTLAVIIPNYNKSKYLSACIESVMQQTRIPDEIVIVDDKSTDNSRQIIQKLCEKYYLIKPIFLKENHGVSYARNTGVRYAETDMVTFLDSDDYYYNNEKLEKEAAIVEHYKDSVVAYSATVKANEAGCVIRGPFAEWRYMSGNVQKEMIANYKAFGVIPRDYMLRKSDFLKSGGYTEGYNLYEDYELSLKLARQGLQFQYTGAMGTAYRMVPNGLSKKNKKKLNKALHEIQYLYWKTYPSFVGKIQIICLAIWQFIRRCFEFVRRNLGFKVDIK